METYYIPTYNNQTDKQMLAKVTLRTTGKRNADNKEQVEYAIALFPGRTLVDHGKEYFPSPSMLPVSYESACALLDFFDHLTPDTDAVILSGWEEQSSYGLQSGTDQDGCTWQEFEVDYFADQTDGECCICDAELSTGWLCLDGGQEICSDHVYFLQDLLNKYGA